MNDNAYIVAFRSNDQRSISLFYAQHRDVFIRDIGKYYRIINSDLISEIYQESVIRLWKNIQEGKLTEYNLTTSLAGYLFSIGKYVALEVFRGEGIRFEKPVEDSEGEIAKKDSIAEDWLWRETERESAVRKAVYKMGEPCSPLLLSFYWDKLSWENIAVLLHYKDANSAKTQKYKCIQKLKAQFV
jgi:DNA-directed RNA polymerase specialized sigma24 family protein